jgi:hypothetical protein
MAGPSNWSRWGADDERGTLNLLGSEEVVRAASAVTPLRLVRGMGSPVNPLAIA